MSKHTVTYTDAEGSKVVAEFDDSASAWNFMRLCDKLSVSAGFPMWVR